MKLFTRKSNECVTLKNGEAVAVMTRKGLVKVSDLDMLAEIREVLSSAIGQATQPELREAINKAFYIICDIDKAIQFPLSNRTAPSPFD